MVGGPKAIKRIGKGILSFFGASFDKDMKGSQFLELSMWNDFTTSVTLTILLIAPII